jgi:hypothetical protein
VPVPGGLPGAVRAILVALAAVLLGLGVALLVAPGWADGAWPWPLTPLTGRAVGAWLVGLGTAAAHARLLDDRASLRPLGITGVVFGVLQIVALARHGEELDWGSAPAAGYLAVLAVLTAVSAWSLLPSPLRRRRRGSDTTTAQSRRPDTPGYHATDTHGHLEGDHRDAAVTDHMRDD